MFEAPSLPEDPRRRARTLSLFALYQMDVGGHSVEEALENVLREESDPTVRDHVTELTRGVREHLEALDRLIEDKAHNWRLERMARVDRNILRLGAYELLHRPGVPAPVVLDEAVELAKEFGDDGSGGFVNGVLDAVRVTEVSSE